MLVLQNISYSHPDKELLFHDINLTVNANNKIGLIGNNGCGKSTLLRIIAGETTHYDHKNPHSVSYESNPFYIPQVFGQFNHLTVSHVLKVQEKINALREIEKGNLTEKNYEILAEEWTIEQRCIDALSAWNIQYVSLDQRMASLSGGEKTKVFLAALNVHKPKLILLDEPSNHLDINGRELLYEYIASTQSTFLIVSHDRKLLNLMQGICELTNRGIISYGGNYDFYVQQKQIRQNALSESIRNSETSLRKAREKERETLERQQRMDSRGKKKQEKSGVARIMMNTLRNNAENSTSKIKSTHSNKIEEIHRELQEKRSCLPGIDTIKFGFDNSRLYKGKALIKAKEINFSYNEEYLWKDNLSLEILSGERISLEGANGSGKTTLINLIIGNLKPNHGSIVRAKNTSVFIDQDYSQILGSRTVYEQAQSYNNLPLKEHEVRTRLNRFLFGKEHWNKPCEALSGGERMRLMLCCLTIGSQSPDIILLDEPTNNLDIQNIEILTNAINEYEGTLIIVSHDQYFLKQINIHRTITVNF